MNHEYVVIFHKSGDRHAIIRVDGPVPMENLIAYAEAEAIKLGGCAFKFAPLCPPTVAFEG